MVASKRLGSEIQEMHEGDVKGNAYTVLNAFEVQLEDKVEKILQLRNPWGGEAFSGLKWNFED